LLCSFYRNIQKQSVIYEGEEEEAKKSEQFNLQAFEEELKEAQKITEHIIIGGDWNAHNPAWLDNNIDHIGEIVLDFIVSNNLHILNSLPFDTTFLKEGGSSSIDISLCSHSLLPLCSNWRTDDYHLDVDSDHLPITFNILAPWSQSRIERQKIETWNLSC
ncbi:reverse transcriptase, partial [Reticulomyxa filosa]